MKCCYTHNVVLTKLWPHFYPGGLGYFSISFVIEFCVKQVSMHFNVHFHFSLMLLHLVHHSTLTISSKLLSIFILLLISAYY